MILGFISLALSIACYSVSQLQQHGKLRWSKEDDSFFGYRSDLRKYKLAKSPIFKDGSWIKMPEKAPLNFYYRYIANVPYKEGWFTSTWLTVAFTDGYHLCQMLFFLLLSLAITLFIGFNWYLLLGIWLGIHIIHAGIYKLLSR